METKSSETSPIGTHKADQVAVNGVVTTGITMEIIQAGTTINGTSLNNTAAQTRRAVRVMQINNGWLTISNNSKLANRTGTRIKTTAEHFHRIPRTIIIRPSNNSIATEGLCCKFA